MKITIHIRGMYCPNCEKRIAAALRKLDGISSVRVDFTTGKAEFESKKALNSEELRSILSELGYELDDGSGELSRAASLLIIILGLAVILDRLGLMKLLVPRQLGESGMSYSMFFVTGLLTSVHCIAMCGGIGLSQSLPGRGLRSSLLYNIGRVVSYTLIGGTLGLIGYLLGGGSFAVSPLLQGVVKTLAGVLMLLAGVNLLGVIPVLRKLQLPLPKLRASSRLPFVIGLLNGLMPCGPLQAIQLAALGSGTPLNGALTMLFFSMGTVPLMLGLGGLVALLGQRFARTVNIVGAVMVAVFGIAMLSQGTVLSGMIDHVQLWAVLIALFTLGFITLIPGKRLLRGGLSLSVITVLVLVLVLFSTVPGKKDGSIRIENGVQLVSSNLEPGSYPDITVQAGLPVRWTIHAEENNINGCNYRMVIPGLDLSMSFHPGENVLEFTPQTAATFPYSCWMGMIRGSIIVTE